MTSCSLISPSVLSGAGRIGDQAAATPLPAAHHQGDRARRPCQVQKPASEQLRSLGMRWADMRPAEAKRQTTKIMSLPCTVVTAADGSLAVLDLKCVL